MTGVERLSASEAVARLAAGDLGCEELVRACLDRAQERAAIEAWAFLDPDRAMLQARAVDRAGRPGLLKGVPVGIKDIIDTVDMPTGHGSPIYRGNRPFADAACVALIRAAGGVVLGKTVTAEFANRHPGATRNPHNPAHTPGGSSSGSAAAVADFHVPLALGTQTGGSVIRPSAFCGVIGYKPSFGDFSRVGVKMQSHSLDTLGIIARTLEDVALLRAVLLGESEAPAPIDRAAAPPRVGFCRTPAWDEADPATQSLLERTAEILAAGAAVREVTLPPPFDDILETHSHIFYFEAARNYAHEYEAHRDQVSEVLRSTVLEPGRALPLAAYVAAVETAESYRRHVDDLFGEFDLLLAPSAAGEAPQGLGSTGSARFNGLWTLAGTPCLTVPAGRGPQGLPLGIQLVGRRGRDRALFDAAAWVEARL
jgi:Asp-tRNA(Asn)/Glu-tRNA(Gln) amidotransferase A subunit family amidase